MPTTSLTLLDRLRRSDQPDAWDRFVRLYAPLLVRWAQLQNFQDADAEDLAQSVLVKLIRLLPVYEKRVGQTFRGWLFTICKNECRDFRTRRATRPFLTGEGASTLVAPPIITEVEEAEYRRLLVRRVLELIQGDFTPTNWRAFTLFVLERQSASEVAHELGMTANAVYLARHRVLTRVRQELADLID